MTPTPSQAQKSGLRESSAVIMRKCLPLMAKHCQSLDPASYAMWFESMIAAEGSRIREIVEGVIKLDKVLTVQEVHAIVREHCVVFRNLAYLLEQPEAKSADKAESADRRASVVPDSTSFSDGVEQLVDSLLKATSEMRVHSTTYEHALERVARTLVPDRGMVGEAALQIEDMADKTRDMVQRMRLLEATLEQSQRHVRELKEENARARREALIDSLTGLPNRRGFDIKLRELMTRSSSESSLLQLGLLIVDLDHFKLVNDRFGHPFGDQVLRAVGKMLATRLPENAFPARLGGEEFGVIVHGSDQMSLMSVAEELRAVISKGRVRMANSEDGHRVTASIGLAIWQSPTESELALFERADKALYAAKAGGRNQCVFQPVAAQSRPSVVLADAEAAQVTEIH